MTDTSSFEVIDPCIDGKSEPPALKANSSHTSAGSSPASTMLDSAISEPVTEAGTISSSPLDNILDASDSTPRTVAKAPFDDPSTADVIILTSDNVSFYTHKIILSIASPHFKEILSQPKLRNDELFSPTKPREREIVVEEDSQTMDYVLRLCYPCNNPPSGATLPLVADALAATIKYKLHIDKVETHLDGLFGSYVSTDCPQAFAAACSRGLGQQASLAARNWRNKLRSPAPCDVAMPQPSLCLLATTPLSDRPQPQFCNTNVGKSYDKGMQTLSAGTFFRLLQFILDENNLTFVDLPSATTCPSEHSVGEYAIPDTSAFDKGQTDIVIRSRDNLLFRANAVVLSFSNADILLQEKSNSREDGLPVIEIDEESMTVYRLLRLCYPFPDKEINSTVCSMEQAIQLACAADRYKMSDALLAAKNILLEYADAHPLPVYFVARRYGWDDLADEAEKECMRLPSLTAEACYTEQMEHVNADVYYELLGRHYTATGSLPVPEPRRAACKKAGGVKKGKKKVKGSV